MVSRRSVDIGLHCDRASVVANPGLDMDIIVRAVGVTVGARHGHGVTFVERSKVSRGVLTTEVSVDVVACDTRGRWDVRCIIVRKRS